MPTDTSVVRLAVDAGQTGIKLRLLAASDEVLSMPGVRTDQALLPQIADAVIATSRALGVRFDEIAVGTTGLSEAESDPERWLALCSLAGVSRVLLAHDSVTSYLGAMGRDEGVVVAAGTGVVTLGVGARTVARVDGWGNIMGDAGSGYWLGRGALDAVMRAYDGRGPATDLTAAVLPRYPNLETAYIELQGDPDRIAVTASFAKAASELADTDAVAAELCRTAGQELALSAATAAQRCALGERPRVCLIGSIGRSTAVRSAFEDALRGRLPDAVLAEPIGDGLGGAAELFAVTPELPLSNSVLAATSPLV